MKIKVLVKTEGCMPLVLDKGDWIDLKLAKDIKLKCPHAKTLHKHKINDKGEEEEVKYRDVIFDYTIAPLGVCIEVPKGFESIVVPRSSSFKKWGILQNNSIGVIDQTYCSDNDEWKMPIVATRYIVIPKGTRIAQFRIQPSQKATMWQKIKWLLSSKIELVEVHSLDNNERGGFGSTGEK